ncbi:peptide/nickel transport system permease protein [Rathayibacter oskolensis]|uniref:Peptide/nickel transport system permease protein n=1 Tax=Rathayibacter oskolensis TaxID=1891671 RepID=A0A1X7PG06_9MICO|nr:dipeptide/oligopeptide/nickel ABC transporter permease/ATP-binding protein [Rathayibacter oskolensis]SMH50424.1 peptide/nickel transport system permease protein [Rathayibacter oskolensis]
MSTAVINTTAAAAPPAARRFKRPSVPLVVALTWLVVVVGSTLLADLVSPYDPLAQDILNAKQPPSGTHLLGTDVLGRDVLSRLIHGATPTLSSVALAVIVYVSIGLVLGLIAGYAGGWTDRAIVAYTSIVIALPGIIVLFVVLSVYRGNTWAAMLVFGFIASPVMVLLVRSSAIAVRNELFVDAARVSGLSPLYIVFQHVLPRSRGLIIVQAAVFSATALIVESSLSYLGFGTQQPDPSWGNMISEAATVIASEPWLLIPPGAVIALTALSLGVIGDSLRDGVSSGWSTSKLTSSGDRPAAVRGPAEHLLEVRDLSVGYFSGGGIVPIVRDVSFSIDRGETVGLVGESGSGKTTVAFGVLGVIGDGVAVTAGSVVFDGTDLVGQSDQVLSAFRGKRIAYVAQEPMVALGPSHRIGDQLAEAVTRNDGLTGAAATERVIELLRLVELRDPAAVSRKYLHELSGGMAQRVSIAFALAGRPELLVADEPTTALDVTVQAGILGLLMRLQDQIGMAMLIITHDWGVIADVCDRVVVMYKGEIVEQAPVEQIFAAPSHPYTQALLVSNPHGAQPGNDLPVITGTFLTPSMERAAEAAQLPVTESTR